MTTSLPLTIARRLGIGLAICVPALVVAQPMLPTFGRNQVLQAEQLTALVTAISALQANAVTKAAIYERTNESGPIAQNADGIANIACLNANDIMLGCSCEGRQGTANSLQLDMRRMTMSNPRGAASACVCQGVNVGTNEVRTIRAVAQCVPVP